MLKDLVIKKDLVEGFFGYFPSFHDDEVLTVKLSHVGPSVSIEILSHQWTNQVDTDGNMVLGKTGIVTLTMESVSEVEIDGLSDHNYLLGIEAEKTDNNCIEMRLIGSTEFGARIVAKTVLVESVVEASV